MNKLILMFVGSAMSVWSLVCPGAHAQTPETVYYADAYADHYGVPRALVHAIIAQESAWNPLAISKKNAEGLMQLMPATAAMYGVGNRFSVIENLGGGVQYLSELLAAFHGDMRLAVAAYYCGPSHILQKGLAYRNSDVLAYVEAVRARYRAEVLEDASRVNAPPAGGN
jgi:soluble lytic murein transglycosylase-like protein